ncbi:MAG: hypothetical protein ACXIUW_15825, partial [Roseinatronobacter sp.]
AVAGAKPMETSVQAWKFAKGLYLIPLFMVFNPEIIYGGPLPVVLWTGLTAILGLIAFASAIEGWLFTRMDPISRLVALPAIIALFWPDLRVEIAGAVAIAVVFLINWLSARKLTQAPAPH